MTAAPLDLVRGRALATLLPPLRLPLSDWIEHSIRLPADVSAEPGPVRLWPFQRGIADAIGDPSIERVTLVKPARVGFSTLLTSALASFVANDPSPVLSVLPTEADARDYVVSDVEPIFDASPALAGLLSGDQAEGGRNTLLSRRFPGGSVKFIAAKSPRNLRRHNARILFVDEADAMLPGPEGSPILLAERRTLSFANRKIVVGSTPTDISTSNVLRAYAASDQRVLELPCPHCGARFELRWRDIRWPEGTPAAAHAVCPVGGCVIEEREKPGMVAAGEWRATAPELAGHAGFRLSALVSLLANASWSRLAAEFIAAKDDPDALRVFVNTILGEGWEDEPDDVDEAAIAGRREPFGLNAIPEEVLSISAGVDVQDDRLEITLAAWTRDDVALVLGHHVIWGSPDDDTTWAELDELLRTTWQHPFGGRLRVDAAVVDSGDGDWTDRVYAFCGPRLNRRIWAGKGVAGKRPSIEASKSRTKGVRLFVIGVDGIKTLVMDRLKRGAGLRFSADLPDVWFEQLVSERRVLRRVAGQMLRRFERIPGARAEALDCLVYAIAARRGVPLIFEIREADLRGEPRAAAPPAVVKSSWMNR